ncbi:MAG: alpha-2-macroglobulin family protein [Desertifilum sp.]|nr:alpha-2-macroglobulin family protein [Desertifilum sp.]
MFSKSWIWRRLRYILLSLLVVSAIAGCRFFTLTPGNPPLAEVAALPLPQLPTWIEQISPTGKAQPLNQIRIIFKEPLIPLESLESSDQQKILNQFEITPALPGIFRFLTPRMVGFQADKALPLATRVQVTLKAGLSDLSNHRLEEDLAWTFNTEPIQISNLPGKEAYPGAGIEPISLRPNLKFTSNVELDLTSLEQHLQLIPQDKNQKIPLKIELAKPETQTQNSEAEFNPASRTWDYAIIPQKNLEKATKYQLQISTGVRPANGNLASEIPFTTQVNTYAPFAFETLSYYGQPDAGGTYGRFTQGSAQLKFNNPIDAKTAEANISISPPPKELPKLIQAYDNDRLVSLNPWALEPNTRYTITVGENLKDKFGQTLSQPAKIQYQTSDVAGSLWVPTGLNIFPTGQDLQLNIETINLPDANYQAEFRVVQPTDLVYVDSAYPRGNGYDLLSSPNRWQTFSAASPKNQIQTSPVNLRQQLGGETGLLAYGVQAKTNSYIQEGRTQWRTATYYGMVELTNLGVFAQWFPEMGIVRVHRLTDGLPVSNAEVEIYQSKTEARAFPQPTPCATGNTNAAGMLVLNRENLQQCAGGERFAEAPSLLVIAKEGQDWAFARTEPYSGIYGYDLNVGWQSNQPESRGIIFSDRRLYQLGEKAAFTGFAYYLQNGEIRQDRNVRYTVTLESPDGKTQSLGNYTTNEFGTFSLEWNLEKNQPLGNYILRGKSDRGVEIVGELRVAEFKPPNFKVDLDLNRQFATMGEKVEANAQSHYLFGAPVAKGTVKYYVTRSPFEFTPKGWEKFAFGQRWYWPEERPTLQSDVLQATQELDSQGQSRETFTIGSDIPYPMTYRVDAEVSDISNLSVANSQTLTVLPSDKVIGLQSNFVADAGQPFNLQLIVTEPTGKAISGERVRLELQQMDYSSVTRVVEGGATAQNQVEYTTVATQEVRSGNQPQTVSLTPPQSGAYRIRANFVNAKNNATATDWQIWATGEEGVRWRNNDNRLEVKLDKDTYKPGETATALFQSPYPEGELYFAVVRDKPLYQRVTRVKGGAPQIQFQVTPEMLPNAAVEAVLVRQGQPISPEEPGKIEELSRIGLAPFQVNLDKKYLQVQVTPTHTEREPGSQQTVQLQVRDSQNRPIRSQLTVMVVNEAVLQLSGYRPPNLVETVYAEQPISTRFSDNRPDVVLQPAASPIAKGWGYGGGFSVGAESTRIRRDFQALAYYQGSVITDNQGKASVTFSLPDDLTTWRVMAVATDGNLNFGQGEATFMTTQALLANPILPQFARPGDRILAGLSITNNTGTSGNIQVNGEVTGSAKFEGKSSTSSKTQAGTQAYRFPMVVEGTGEAKVKFISQLNNLSDAFEVPLEIRPYDITEQVIETGTTDTQVSIALNVDKNVIPHAGGLEISLASTLIPEITLPALETFQQDAYPFLEPVASQLLVAANLQILGQQYNQDFSHLALTEIETRNFELLQQLQQTDGGFASYPTQQQSDPFVTPYVAEALTKASQAGLNVDAGMQTQLQAYLKKLLANPSQNNACTDHLCKAQIRLNSLMALAEMGETRNDFLSDIYAQRSEFDPVTQIKLARYLTQVPEWRQEAQTLIAELQETLSIQGRSATVNLPELYHWLSSPTVTQAQALRLFVAENPRSETTNRLLQSLLNLRREGTWGSTYNNAEALTALVEYAKTESAPPNFSASVKLGNQVLGSPRFTGYRNSTWSQTIPTAELPKGKHNLVLQKSGNGKLHYLTAYRYRLPGNSPGRLNGLRVIREVRTVGETEVLQKTGLYAMQKPFTVKPGQVFDIGLQIITDHPVNHVAIVDPLPAGLEAVDASFQTSTPALEAQADSWQIGYQTIGRDRIIAYADRLSPGVYQLHYLARSVTPGTYSWPGAEAHLQYAPEEFGRTASTTLVVSGS